MKDLAIINGILVMPDGCRDGFALLCRGGKIAGVIPASEFVAHDDLEVIDAAGNYVSPGFVDIHVHGGGGYDFMDGTVEAWEGAARLHAEHGTTAMLPTTLSSSDEELDNALMLYESIKGKERDGARFLGLHLEGPYFSPQYCGAQDPNHMTDPDPKAYRRAMDICPDILRWSVAPELPGALEMGRELSARGVLMSMAHSAATYEQALAAVESGYSMLTHFYCAMSTIVRKGGFRLPGLVESGYLIDDVKLEIIADGCHVPASLLWMACRFKGTDKIVLCTDAMRAAGMPEGEYTLGSLDGGQKVIVEDGVAKLMDRSAFAGSVATTDRLVRTMVKEVGVPVYEAVRMMSFNPAEAVGYGRSLGSLEAGKDADMVIFDKDIIVKKTIVKGKVVYEL